MINKINMKMSVIKIFYTIGLIVLQVRAQQLKNVTKKLHFNKTDANLINTTATQLQTEYLITQNTQITAKDKINVEIVRQTTTNKPFTTATTVNPFTTTTLLTDGINNILADAMTTTTLAHPLTTTIVPSTSSSTSLTFVQPDHNNTSTTTAATAIATNISSSLNQYCAPSLCEFFNGTHNTIRPHIACKNSGNFGAACGSQPHLLKMSERRRNLILNLHNLARSRIATGQVEGYKSASHMPQLKWDYELEYLATLHVKRCEFEHDLCHNTPRYPYSGQNIGYFWKGVNITSHSKRMKNFIVNWYKEHVDANQTFIDSFHLHPEDKVIGHFTAMIGDRVHHVGCAAIHFYVSNLTKILMTCNYDYNNFADEPVYKTGPAASKCAYKISSKFPGLCDWKVPLYEYEKPVEEVNNYENSSSNVLLRL